MWYRSPYNYYWIHIFLFLQIASVSQLQHVCGPNIHHMCKYFGTITVARYSYDQRDRLMYCTLFLYTPPTAPQPVLLSYCDNIIQVS